MTAPTTTTTTTSFSSPPSPPAALFRLPLELRQQIYTHLLPRDTVAHPLPGVGIAAVSHRPPAPALLRVHPRLARELLDHFHARATWQLVLSHAFNFYRVDRELRGLAASPALARMRRLELVVFCDALLLREYPSFGPARVRAELRARAARACEVLCAGAPRLRRVTVSWVDTTTSMNLAATGLDAGVGTDGGEDEWEEKATVLEPLRGLADACTGIVFQVGEVVGPDARDRERFVDALRRALGPGSKLEMREQEVEEDEVDEKEDQMDGVGIHRPSQYRMLAFDTQQDRLQFATQPGSFPRGVTRRSGWRGAPPLLDALRE